MWFFRIIPNILILLILCALPVHALKDGTVKKKVLYAKDASRLPKIAIDQKKGMVAVLWSNRKKNDTNQTCRVIFINAKKAKKIKYGKVLQVNIGGDAGSIAYNTKSKKFVSIWDNESGTAFTYSSLFSRIYNRKGISSGSSFIQQPNDISNQHPNIFFIPGPNNFIVIFQKQSKKQSERPQAGLFSMILGPGGKKTGAPKKLRTSEVLHDGSTNLDAYATDVAYNSKSKRIFVIVAEETSEEGSTDPRQLKLYQLTPQGKLLSIANLTDIWKGNETLTWYSGLSPQNKASSAHHFVAYGFKNSLIVKRISSTGNVEKVIGFPDVPDCDFADIAYNPQDNVYLLVSEEKNGLSARYLDASGNVKGKPIKLSNFADARRCVVEYNQKMKEFFVVWVERKKVNDLVMLSTIKRKP